MSRKIFVLMQMILSRPKNWRYVQDCAVVELACGVMHNAFTVTLDELGIPILQVS